MTLPHRGPLEARVRMAARLPTGTAGPERRLAEFGDVGARHAPSA